MKTKSQAVLVSFMLIICLMLCSFTNASSNASDELTVNNYANLYWGINIKITSSVNKVEISDDDPIINLVPKELFNKDNTTLNILGDYAYFIKTKELSKVLYQSDVILIDISTSTDLSSPDSKSQIIQTITPVFEGQYYCIDFMTYDEFNFLGNNYINQTTVSNLVTPAVDTNNNLMNETNYYLTNVSFTSFLANKQHLNPGDLNYDPNVDHGSYFIRSDLYFNGLGAKDYSDIGTYIYDSYGVALDIAIDFIPELKYLDYLSKIFNFLKVDSERLNILTRDEWRVNEEYQELYKVITYASMVEQVENYGGLVKYMSNSINSSSDGPLLFKPDSNNYVMNKFTIGTTKNWSTVINNKISFSVVDNNGNLYATSSGYSSYDLRGNEIKNIPDMNVDVEGYILLQNSDYFSFIPQYSSYYNINLDGYNVSVSLNNQKVESTNQCYYLEVDKEYIIEIMGDKPGVFNFKLSVPSLNDWSLPLAKGEYLFEFTNNSPDLYQLSFNDNVIVSILNDNFITIANLDNNPYIFLNNFTYYILIKALEDNASLNYEYVNIENVNIDQIYSNNTNQAKYYSFVADTAGYYYITEFLGNNISFYLKGDSTNVDYIVSSNSNLVRYKIYLNANDKLYLGYNNAINYKFSISLADNYISWHQDGEKITSDFIVLRQGDQTTISVYITNENVSQNLSIETYSARGITFNPVNGLLQISNDAIPTEIESAPYHLFISFDDEIYSLYVYVTVNVNINMFVDNPNYIEYENDKNIIQGGVKIQVYAANPNDIFKITVKSKLGSGKVINYGPYILKDGDTIYVHLNSNALIEEKIDSNGENVKTAINNIKAIFSIDYVEYEQKDIDNGTRTFKIYNAFNYDVDAKKTYLRIADTTVDTLFGGGDGTPNYPFVLFNERHLFNMQYALREYREGMNSYYYIRSNFILTNNITVSHDIPTLPSLRDAYINGDAYYIYAYSHIGTLFNKIYSSTIDTLYLSNFNIDNADSTYVGCLANVIDSSTIHNVYMYSSSISTTQSLGANNYVGGFAGYSMESTFDNCFVCCYITSPWNIGGYVGFAYNSKFNNCCYNATIDILYFTNYEKEYKNIAVGSICGLIYGGGIENCTFDGAAIIHIKDNGANLSDDGEYVPYVGCMAGLSQYGTEFINNYRYGTVDLEPLHSWWAWFQTWDQLAHVNVDGDCGVIL